MCDKRAVALVKDVRQLGFVLQDTEPPESSSSLRKSTKVLGPIRRVRFTRTVLRQANIRENNGPSLNKIQVKLPHISGGDWKTRAMRLRRRVETCQKYSQIQSKRQSSILFTYRWVEFAGRIHNKTGKKESLWQTREQVCIQSAGKTSTLPNWIP